MSVTSQKSEIRSQKSGVRNQKSEVRSQKSGVRNQKSEVRSQKSGVRNQKSEVRSQKSEVRSKIYSLLITHYSFFSSQFGLSKYSGIMVSLSPNADSICACSIFSALVKSAPERFASSSFAFFKLVPTRFV